MRPHATFKLEAVTALFLHGADHRRVAELRAGSLKAAARYWFRAAIGDAVPLQCRGDKAAKSGQCGCLRCTEGRVFGSTIAGTGMVFHVPATNPIRSQDKFLLPQHNRRGAYAGRRGGSSSPSPSPALPAGTTFDLQIYPARPTAEAGHLEAAVAAFWLAVHLGGFGQRARRGGGSVRVRELKGSCDLPRGLQPDNARTDIGGFARQLGTGIGEARRTILHVLGSAREPTGSPKSPPPFPLLRPDSKDCAIQAVRLTATDEEKVREEIMVGLQRFKDPIFGLPYLKPASGQAKVSGRHASPLLIHVEKLASGGFAAVQTALRSSSVVKEGRWSRLDDYLRSFADRSEVKFA